MSLTNPQQLDNKSVVMEFGKRHDATDTTDYCPRQLVTYTCLLYGETGVMDFGLYHALLSEHHRQLLNSRLIIVCGSGNWALINCRFPLTWRHAFSRHLFHAVN